MGRRKRYSPYRNEGLGVANFLQGVTCSELQFAVGQHTDESLKERYRLDHIEMSKITGLDTMLREWVVDNLQNGPGIIRRDHAIKYRLEMYSGKRPIMRNGVAYYADSLDSSERDCVLNIDTWFRNVSSDQWWIVEVGFNASYQICKLALNVWLPTKRVLFLAIGADRGLKTFYVNDRPKVPKGGRFRCTSPECDYVRIDISQ